MKPSGYTGLWLVLALGGSAVAADLPEKRTPPPQGPVQIRSDELQVQQKDNRALFLGRVEAVQDDLTVRCEELEVRYEPTGELGKGRGEIRLMIFRRGVEIVQGERRGHCEQAEYDRRARKIVCTGEPWVVEGPNRIEGEQIDYLLDRDEVRVRKPRAVIQLPEEKSRPAVPAAAGGGR